MPAQLKTCIILVVLWGCLAIADNTNTYAQANTGPKVKQPPNKEIGWNVEKIKKICFPIIAVAMGFYTIAVFNSLREGRGRRGVILWFVLLLIWAIIWKAI